MNKGLNDYLKDNKFCRSLLIWLGIIDDKYLELTEISDIYDKENLKILLNLT